MTMSMIAPIIDNHKLFEHVESDETKKHNGNIDEHTYEEVGKGLINESCPVHSSRALGEIYADESVYCPLHSHLHQRYEFREVSVNHVQQSWTRERTAAVKTHKPDTFIETHDCQKDDSDEDDTTEC